ncbi:Gcd10p family-domain-containing protein [Dipodascopsis uninucleata]
MNEDTIQANSYVLIRMPSSTLRITQVVPNTTIHLGKFGSFFADDIIGRPYGYTYEIQDSKHVEVLYSAEGLFPSSATNEDENEDEADVDDNKEDSIGTNELTYDDPNVQKLSMREIEELKRSSSGEEIIRTVIKSHTAFQQKTIFSKEKYKRRKQQKFLRRFTPSSVGSCEIIEYFQYKDQNRILELTAESIGLMMSLGDIRRGGKYIVMEETGGLITGTMLERMGGDGEILFLHENEHPNFEVMKYMNFPESMTQKMVKSLNLLQLFDPDEEEEVKILSDETLASMKPSRRGQYYRKLSQHKDFTHIIEQLRDGIYDGLILATTFETEPLLEKLIPCLEGSRQIVLYNNCKEPLISASHKMMADLRVLAPTIMETRARKYQVFPGRTHPLMTMKSGGGYLLFGTRVLPSKVQAGNIRKRRKIISNNNDNFNDTTQN